MSNTATSEARSEICPTNHDQVAEAVRSLTRLRVRAGGSKTALSTTRQGETRLDVSRLSGMVDYDPQELTFTALASTPVAQLQEELARQGQCLPFDPLWVEGGATLGGTVACGLAGAASYGYGGVRDFLIGVRWVDGRGRLLRGGGRVVKNAAGFDTPKLWVGSLGCLGVLVELTCKVFPSPASQSTWRLRCERLEDAVAQLTQLARAPVQMDALELEAPHTLWCRLVGAEGTSKARSERLQRALEGAPGHLEEVPDDEAEGYWRQRREVQWSASDAWFFKIPLTPGRILSLEKSLASTPARRVYGRGGQVLWLSWPSAARDSPAEFRNVLEDIGLQALLLAGPSNTRGGLWTGHTTVHPFWQRIRQVFDPHDKFPTLAAQE